MMTGSGANDLWFEKTALGRRLAGLKTPRFFRSEHSLNNNNNKSTIQDNRSEDILDSALFKRSPSISGKMGAKVQ